MTIRPHDRCAERPRAHAAGRALALLALPLLIWAVGSFYFRGDLGRWLDDYAAHVRDPVTGSFEWSNLLKYQWWFFWRPIHVHLVFALQTLLWNQPWLNHLFSALMHALACWSLWRFLRTCAVRRVIAASAALVMLGSVQGFEAILWPATVSTSIATAALLWAGQLTIRIARGERGRGAIIMLGVLGFITPCLYEQPAAALAALPILYLGACWPGPSDAALRRLMGAVVSLTPCAFGLILYLLLYTLSVREHPTARESRFIPAAEFWPHATYTLWAMGVMLDPVRGLEEVWTLGVQTLRASPVRGWLLGGVSLLAATLWVTAWSRDATRREHESRAIHAWPVAPAAILWFGIAAFLLALFPIAAIDGAGPSPRLAYFPLACVLIAVAALAQWALQRLPPRPLARSRFNALIAGGAAALALSGAIHLVGVQSAMRSRSDRDLAQMQRLHDAIPSPSPGTIFVPIAVAPAPRTPMADRLRISFQPIWSSPWAVNTYIKHVYHSRDINASALYMHNQSSAIVRLGEPTIIAWSHYIWRLPQPRVEATCPTFPTNKVVPFAVDAEGQVTLISELRARRPDGSEATFEFLQAAAAGAAESRMIALPVQTGRPWLTGWRWPRRKNEEVKFRRIGSWGASELAVRMHPPTPGVVIEDGDTDSMTLPLEPSPSARTLVFYATFNEATIDLSALGDGVDLAWSLDPEAAAAGATEVLRTQRLDPKEARTDRLWRTITVEIPPLATPRTLRLSAGPGPSGSPDYDRVLVTCGEDATPLSHQRAQPR